MATYLEKVFRNKVKDEELYKPYLLQWERDKALVPKALNTINNIFPHYSLHDESHSESILKNIIKILGTDIVDELSVADLWLILEAAYCHDLGMVVTADMIDEAVLSGKFMDYFVSIKDNPDDVLHEYTRIFDVKDGKLFFNNVEVSSQNIDSYKFLLAGYFRKYHAENSKKVIVDREDRLNLPPHEEGIPERLFAALGDICHCHGKSFADVMKMESVEDGIDLEYAHPRFVACLLRIGDVLDIDNNRFSRILLKTINKMPADSEIHRKKHLSIGHVHIDDKRVEANATCPNPQVAKVTNEWFDWIRDEFREQAVRWADIKPDELNFALPTLGEFKTDIEGGYMSFSSEDMPQFTINTGKALELLQGNNLYDNIWDSIRELLQNAVDSTLIRYFLDKEYEFKGREKELTFDFSNTLKELQETKDYQIEVKLVKGDDGIFTLTIKDNGLGLKRDHLKFLSNTGNSSNNLEKKKIVERMPEWLKPSGTFGIGFQSVYLLTDRVDIVTKDYFTDECYELEMHKPSSAMRGDIYVKKHEERIHNSGLELKIELNAEKVKELDKKVVDIFDAVGDASLVEYQISAKVREYGEISLVPIKYNDKVIERKESLYYDKENGIELLGMCEDYIPYNFSLTLYYRNANVKSSITIVPMTFSANILKGKASQLLGISRDELKEEYSGQIEKCVVESLKNWILSEKFDIHKVEGECPKGALKVFAMYYGFCEEFKTILGDCYDVDVDILRDLNDYIRENFKPSEHDGKKITFEMLKSKGRLELTLNGEQEQMAYWDDEKKCYVLSLLDSIEFENLSRIFNRLYDNCYEIEESERIFTNMEIKSEIKEVQWNFDVENSRIYFPYIPGYDDIYISSGKGIDDHIGIGFKFFQMVSLKQAKILSPFLLVNDEIVDARNDKFYQFVHECNGNPIEDINECYDRFVKYVVDLMCENAYGSDKPKWKRLKEKLYSK